MGKEKRVYEVNKHNRRATLRVLHITKHTHTHTYLLNRITKFPPGEFIPQTFNGGKIRGGDALHFGKVDKVPSFCFGTGEYDECIAGELIVTVVCFLVCYCHFVGYSVIIDGSVEWRELLLLLLLCVMLICQMRSHLIYQ